MAAKTQDVTKRAREAHVRNLERALKEERTGLVAVAKAFLEESPNSGALLRRLEAMVRAANANSAPARTRDAIGYGYAVLARAAEQAQGKPQGLFDPHVGHVPPAKVEALTTPSEHVQVGLEFRESTPLADVEAGQSESSAFAQRVRATILTCYEGCGALTDGELRAEYTRRAGPVTAGLLKDHRKALTRTGRVVKSDETTGEDPRWTLLERK
jgi:hypothetical protein